MPDFKLRMRGYSKKQVDALEKRVERVLAGSGEMTADDLRAEIANGFDVVVRGYDPGQVHAAVQEWLRRLERLS